MNNSISIISGVFTIAMLLLAAMSIQHAPEPSECYLALVNQQNVVNPPDNALLTCVAAEAGIELVDKDNTTINLIRQNNKDIYYIDQLLIRATCVSQGAYWEVDAKTLEITNNGTWGVVC